MRAFLALLLLAGCASSPSHDQLRATALRLTMPGGGVCSGTAVAADTLATAQHCLADGLLTVNGQPVRVVAVAERGRDLALVKVAGIRFSAWARIGPALAQGDPVRWFGNPAGEANMYREGYVVRAQTDAVLIDGHGFGGDSGSGIFDAQGRLVGVLSGVQWWRDPRSGLVFALVVVFPV